MDRKKLINRNVLWEVFNTYDVDEKGFISLTSVEKAIERTGKKKSFDDIKYMFKELGLSIDAQITFEDFCRIIEEDL